MNKTLFTSESVTEGHPDKICDRISDAVVDAVLSGDKNARIACEAAIKDNTVWVFGEITTTSDVDYEAVARRAMSDIGYTKECGFSAYTCDIKVSIQRQSPDIAIGVDSSMESKNGAKQQLGAGDQGMMFGYACDETPEYMPMPISFAHKLSRALTDARKSGLIAHLRPDGKSQVTVEYDGGIPVRIDSVVVSSQHDPVGSMDNLRNEIKEKVILANLPAQLLDNKTKYYVNPTGRFIVGGPVGDSGLTGRKIIVDTYGGYSRHGGGCFSGKDPTKVDRSASYMARYIAKNVVASGLAKRCEVQLAYAIGVANPVSVLIETFGTETAEVRFIQAVVLRLFDLRPSGIIEKLVLRAPIYTPLSAYGHVGREDLNVPWENIDMADDLHALAMGKPRQQTV
jgi:S-adenosylmethionine synthetase